MRVSVAGIARGARPDRLEALAMAEHDRPALK
jgi:hypothetical protein